MQVQYIDGTKIESVANKYSFVWKGSVEKYDARLREKTDAILKDIEQVIEAESRDTSEDRELSTEEFSSRVERIKERMQSEGMTQGQRKQVKELDAAVEKMAEYDHKREVLGNRNSYSKRDEDATFMRMKEDAMLNGQVETILIYLSSFFYDIYESFPLYFSLHRSPYAPRNTMKNIHKTSYKIISQTN